MNYFASRYLSMGLLPPQNTQPLKHIQVVLHESCKPSSHHRAKRASEYSLLKSEKVKARNRKKESGWMFLRAFF